jgi:tRNA 5-methylaminomethyl-2-thiouridine biosynthesis bifunctional protein
MLVHPSAAVLSGCGLPQVWNQQEAWRILETDFDVGLNFLSTWRAWKDHPKRPRMLHYVSLTASPASADRILSSAAPIADLTVLAHELACQWFELLPGFHRLTLEDGKVLLTLCVGGLMPMLREQQFLADAVYLVGDPYVVHQWDGWAVKALAKCCRRGTSLVSTLDAPDLRADLTQCGFELNAVETKSPGHTLAGQFNPRWKIKSSRQPALVPAVAAGTCVVVGAGLAGASVAAALARRGWRVQVLDHGAAPATGASGLPVGLVVPHLSADDCPLSRLSRSGVRLMLQQAGMLLLRGQDWDATGVLERRFDGDSHLPDIWHAQAAWLKPAQLVRAWLEQSGVTFQGDAKVDEIRPSGGQWELLNALGEVLATADRIVFANANGALELIERTQARRPGLGINVRLLPVMHSVAGQLSWAMHKGAPDNAFPPFPLNGSGSVIPQVPTAGGTAWYVGSSYQHSSKPAATDEENHASNLARLQKLLPNLGPTLAGQFASGPINGWKNVRCVTSDRLPLVGPVYRADYPSLWICAGMGSRGLSFSVLCAELLAATWGAEPLPVASGLARSLNPLRRTGASL